MPLRSFYIAASAATLVCDGAEWVLTGAAPVIPFGLPFGVRDRFSTEDRQSLLIALDVAGEGKEQALTPRPKVKPKRSKPHRRSPQGCIPRSRSTLRRHLVLVFPEIPPRRHGSLDGALEGTYSITERKSSNATLPVGSMRMTSAPWTKVPLRGSLPKPGSLSMVPVEMGPTELTALANVRPVTRYLQQQFGMVRSGKTTYRKLAAWSFASTDCSRGRGQLVRSVLTPASNRVPAFQT